MPTGQGATMPTTFTMMPTTTTNDVDVIPLGGDNDSDEGEDPLSSVPDDLWECLFNDENDNGDNNHDPSSSSPASSPSPTTAEEGSVASSKDAAASSTGTTTSTTTTTTTSQLEEKFLSLESMGPSLTSTAAKDMVDDFINADHSELDTILANDMNRLSFEERFQYTNEIHGIKPLSTTIGSTSTTTSTTTNTTNSPPGDKLQIQQQHCSAAAGTISSNVEDIESNEEFVNEKLKQLEECLSLSSSSSFSSSNSFDQQSSTTTSTTVSTTVTTSRDAYDHAMYLSPEYVTNRQFRLLFLRGENYDVMNAAKRMLLHFHIKKELFGKVRYTQRFSL